MPARATTPDNRPEASIFGGLCDGIDGWKVCGSDERMDEIEKEEEKEGNERGCRSRAGTGSSGIQSVTT